MILIRRKALAFIALLFFATCSAGMAEVAVPPLAARVTDLTGTLSSGQIAQLDQKLAAFEASKGSQIAVLMVPTTSPETIEQYSIRVADAWKLGRKGVDDGVLLLIAKEDRALRMEVGYGLEGVLPDAMAKRIIEDIIVPELRQGNFPHAIDAGIDGIMRVVEGEPLPAPSARRGGSGASGGADLFLDNIFFVFIVLLVVAKMLQSIFGRFIGATLTSGAAGVLSWLVFSSVAMALVIGLLAFFVSLFGQSPGGISRGGRHGWPGGFGGMGGRGGFGGGGFGGGGGGFGGGGASGRW